MKQSVPPDSPMAQSVDSSIAEARELGGLKAPAAAIAAAPKPAETNAVAAAPRPAETKPSASSTASSGATITGAAVAGEVKLMPVLAGAVAPTDTVFVF